MEFQMYFERLGDLKVVVPPPGQEPEFYAFDTEGERPQLSEEEEEQIRDYIRSLENENQSTN